MAIINACCIAFDLKDTYAMHKCTEAGGPYHLNVWRRLLLAGKKSVSILVLPSRCSKYIH